MQEERPPTRVCPSCQHENPALSSFCNACGADLRKPQARAEEEEVAHAQESEGALQEAQAAAPESVRAVEAAFEAAQARQRMGGESAARRYWIVGCAGAMAIVAGAVVAVVLNVGGMGGRRKPPPTGRPGRAAARLPHMRDIFLAEGTDEGGEPVGIIHELRPGEFGEVVCFYTSDGRPAETTLIIEWSRLGEVRDQYDRRVSFPDTGETGSFAMPLPPELESGLWTVRFLAEGAVVGELQIIVSEAYARR